MQGRLSKEKYMNTRNINFNLNSSNLIIINEKSEETINEKTDKNNYLIYNSNTHINKSNITRKNSKSNVNTGKNYEEFQRIEDENERKLYILNAFKKNLELHNEKAKEDENLNIVQNFNKIVDIKNKEELLKKKSNLGYN